MAVFINSIIIGDNAKTSANDCVVFGANANTSELSSVAIGKDSKATREFEVSFGNESIKRVLSNIDSAKLANDAVNLEQLSTLEAKVEELKDEINRKISSVFRYKGSVLNASDLNKISDREIGDTYNVEASGANYVWDGKGWDRLNETIDLSLYARKDELANKVDIELLNGVYTKVDGFKKEIDSLNKQRLNFVGNIVFGHGLLKNETFLLLDDGAVLKDEYPELYKLYKGGVNEDELHFYLPSLPFSFGALELFINAGKRTILPNKKEFYNVEISNANIIHSQTIRKSAAPLLVTFKLKDGTSLQSENIPRGIDVKFLYAIDSHKIGVQHSSLGIDFKDGKDPQIVDIEIEVRAPEGATQVDGKWVVDGVELDTTPLLTPEGLELKGEINE
ncbi:hypothetical protein CBLAS_0934 [Campylobacter blaseri]|uniref:Uncharacterized protein n=1 Tax=Campylobacter blaseri TaxID=2042961 RepID=A0A2P8QYQ1_9BACT|nr:hypothetical protein [Campylobacter blaseri]PSM51368.1 hypothetical protein CQ405_08235 [Campylobacter blaseri]PSM52818.1 hypothetical protein CRN67_08240 [Campylobacter blaseri]QKF86119.1 hypothetical protein CBLAS_0934 [Campylobacter blaseri]